MYRPSHLFSWCDHSYKFFLICFKFSPFLSQIGSQLHPHFSNYPVLLALDSLHTPHPWQPQIGSGNPEKHTPSLHELAWLPWFQAPKVLEMRQSKSSPAESSSLGVTSQLCHSSVSRPNSALGRGGIRNPVSWGVPAPKTARPPRLLFSYKF